MSFTETDHETLRYKILAQDESIFCFGESEDAERIRRGKKNPEGMIGQEQHPFVGSTPRLLAYGDHDRGPAPIPRIANEGFMWCGHAVLYSSRSIDEYTIPGGWRSERDRYLFELTPRSMEGVYIADHDVFEAVRESFWRLSKAAGRDSLTDVEMRHVYSARARTIVPIAEYDGSYKQPIILVRCDILSYDEIQLVSGPWPMLVRGALRY